MAASTLSLWSQVRVYFLNIYVQFTNRLLGDGIGAEVAESVKTIFKADNVPIEWEQVDVSGVESGDKHSEELFRESIASLRRNKLGLKGWKVQLWHGLFIT